MTLYLCVSLIVVGLVLTFDSKAAIALGVVAVAGGFGFRLMAGEEARAVMTDALFIVALLPVAWWGAKQLLGVIDAQRTQQGN